MTRYLTFILLNFCCIFYLSAQQSDKSVVDYSYPKEYEIGGIQVIGVKYLDHNVLIQLSGLTVGDVIMIPGEEVADAVRKLWKQGLFSDVEIRMEKTMGNKVFLEIYLQERPRLSAFTFNGLKKAEIDEIREKIKLVRGTQVTDNVIMTVKNKIENYFVDKGYLNAHVNIVQENDTNLVNNVILHINVDKVDRIKINSISFSGNMTDEEYKENVNVDDLTLYKKVFRSSPFSDSKLRRAMKDTKEKTWWNIFKTSKFIESNFERDKQNIIDRYNEYGYRDAKIVFDTVYPNDEKTINIEIKIDEGDKYYFRNITWVGNTKYTSERLDDVLGIERGDVYNQSVLDEQLFIAQNGVFSLYQDDGYLFSSVTPVEVQVENDSIDIEMRVYEGKQARINRVAIVGNERTNEHVIRREIRTKPGQLYNRSDIQRTIRELAQLGYFDPEKLNVDFKPDPQQGTVDLEYTVEEKPSDQFELSGGWGAQMVVGSVGLSFTNFALRKVLKLNEWKPVPTGDGQRISIRAQSNGVWYQSYSMSFVEPWLGGKKPNSLQFQVYHNVVSNGQKRDDPDRKSMQITGVSLGLGRRLKKPDDFFTLYNEVSYQQYNLNGYNWNGLFSFDEGYSNNVSFKTTLSRNSSGPNPIFPVKGSEYSFSFELTPPYSLFKDDSWWTLPEDQVNGIEQNISEEYDVTSSAFQSLVAEEIKKQEDIRKYLWIEYHKWSFKALNYLSLAKFGKHDLVLHTRAEFGYIGYYNSKLGPSPFEGYYMGGDGLMTYNIYGKETIPLRGYANGSLTPKDKFDDGKKNGNVYDKFTLELRFPLSLNPSATLYGLTFVEAGNAWYEFSDFNAFDVKRSAGVGVRIFLPMFGKLGVDWGYGFDNDVTGVKSGSQFHFIIGQSF